MLRLLPNEMGCLVGVEARDQAAVELQVSFVLLLRVCCVDCTCVGPRVAAIKEQCERVCVAAFRSINGDAKLTSQF